MLHFEGKLWRTLPLLAWKPGELTRRYIHGERARFVSPMALFLFTVFLMFALFSAVGIGVDTTGFRNSAGFSQAIDQERDELRQLRRTHQQAVRAGDRANAEAAAATIRETEEGIRALTRFVTANEDNGPRIIARETGWKAFDDGVKKLNANPALAFYKVQANAYKFSWALIPISVPFVWLLFLHRKRYRQFKAYDHAVFVTYSIAFMSMVLLVGTLLSPVPGTGLLSAAIIAIPPLHIYRQLRGAYELKPWSAVWRTVVLLLVSGLAITLFLLLLMAIGALG